MKSPFSRRATCAVLAAALAVGGFAAVRASGQETPTAYAYLGGLETGKSAVPELVVFNTQAEDLSLTLVLRDEAGRALATSAAPLVVGGFKTAAQSLSALLLTAGTAGKPYAGRFSLEVSGGLPFSQDNAVVHVTQYFGRPAKGAVKPAKPTSAFVVRPLFATR
jgi:hypothetical protein